MTKEISLDDALDGFKHFCAENPYTGTTQQIVTLSLGLYEAGKRLKPAAFRLYKEATDINPKIVSKLNVIGKTLGKLNEKERRDVVKQLPASYSTIHLLCSLPPNELVTAARSGSLTPTISIREAKDYVTQVRFPQIAATDGDKGRWGAKQEHLFSVYRPEEHPLAGEALQALETALRQVCADYGVELRHAKSNSTKTLKQQARAEREVFWRGLLQKELTRNWFVKQPEAVKKQFNLKTMEELHEAPLRSFTGFLIKADGGRELFWEKHGQAYVAKLQLLMEKTEDNAQRYNLKRRLEEVMETRRELTVWNNIMLKNSGFLYR